MAEPPPPPPERRRREKTEEAGSSARVITPLVPDPVPADLEPLFKLRSMWQLASVLNFLHVRIKIRMVKLVVFSFTSRKPEEMGRCGKTLVCTVQNVLFGEQS